MIFMETKLIKHTFNSIVALYAIRDDIMTFTIVPSKMLDLVNNGALFKNDWEQHYNVDPMVQVALKGDEVQRDFSAGNTLYNSTSSFNLRFIKQDVIETDERKEVRTILRNKDIQVTHVVSQAKGYEAIEMYNVVTNISNKDLYLDKISSFFVGCLSPFMHKNNPEKIVLHELKSYWSMEARKVSVPISNYFFEDSRSAYGIKIHRISVNGTMPSAGYHPFVGVEDVDNKVTWAVQLEAPCSWEIETIHRYGRISISGGQADFLSGHWRKKMLPNEDFSSRKAYISVVNGDLTLACSKLTKYHDNLLSFPKSEENLPVIFNEYLTTLGNPNIKNILNQLPYLKYLECEYYVVDSGWFCERDQDNIGDWIVSKDKFPNGLKEYTDYMRQNGFSHCGIWFEFENVTDNSVIVEKHPEFLAKRDGEIIHRGNRMFLDFAKEEVNEYLAEKVIKTIRDNNISYIKIDYNENVGLGIDYPDSIGEGLRIHSEKVIEFMKKIRKEFPDLVLENCSSGGMRHEITYNTVSSMCSFSDAHENPDGVVVAMDLHRIMQPRIMQVWACLRKENSIDDIYVTVAKAMLGRICFAGCLEEISKETLDVALKGKHFYDKIKHIIKNGTTTLIDTEQIKSLNNPHGAIKLMRESLDNNELLCYAFNFGEDIKNAEFNLNNQKYRLVDKYGNANIDEKGNVTFKGERSAVVAVYKKI